MCQVNTVNHLWSQKDSQCWGRGLTATDLDVYYTLCRGATVFKPCVVVETLLLLLHFTPSGSVDYKFWIKICSRNMLIHLSSTHMCSLGTAEGVSRTVIDKVERGSSDWVKQKCHLTGFGWTDGFTLSSVWLWYPSLCLFKRGFPSQLNNYMKSLKSCRFHPCTDSAMPRWQRCGPDWIIIAPFLF